jgi:hypothetical protein
MSHNDNPTVDFNLDTFKNEVDLTPFVVVHGGKPYTLTHLDELDGWEAVAAFANGSGDSDLLRLALGEKFDEFRKSTKLKRGAMQALVRRYLAHCGVETGN